ncbi:MAG: hypothetical protein HY255_06070 [Betaproteobacteria bacterium]|nr:hypothetical protein [Betaproteobacteria bacterium]
MNTPLNLQRDPVDEWIKADAAATRAEYIDDAGFTLRVMDALPAASLRVSRLRFGLPMAGAVLAAVLAGAFSPIGNFMIDAIMDILTNTPSNSAYGLFAIVTAMACAAVVALQGDR